jgi:hypothetical protein
MKKKVFITGADKNCQWLLPWFITKFNKHNGGIPLVVCDFGLEEKALNWLSKKNIEVQKTDGAKGWFFKPTALRSVEGEQKFWIDVDIEIRGSIKEVFQYIQPNKLATSTDRWHSWGCKYQTGIVGVEGDPKILQEWEVKCQNPTGPYSRGDQELLWDLTKDDASNICNIPENFNWLRMSLERGEANSDIRMVHWTGEAGKKVITKSIREKKDTFNYYNVKSVSTAPPRNPTSGYGGITNATDGQIL